MTVKLKRWGNSLGLRIPHQLAKELSLSPEQEYTITVVDGSLLVSPVEKMSLDQLLEGMSRDMGHEEQTTDFVGKERYWEADE